MRIFLAGASGVIGTRLVPLLVGEGHEVAGMTRSPRKCEALRELGATTVLCDVFDEEALCDAVVGFRPELVMHQLTDLPADEARIAALASANARMRRVGTANLLAASGAAGAARFLAQSVAWELTGDSGEEGARGAGARRRRQRPPLRPVLRARDVPRERAAGASTDPDRRGRATDGRRADAPSGVLEIVEP